MNITSVRFDTGLNDLNAARDESKREILRALAKNRWMMNRTTVAGMAKRLIEKNLISMSFSNVRLQIDRLYKMGVLKKTKASYFYDFSINWIHSAVPGEFRELYMTEEEKEAEQAAYDWRKKKEEEGYSVDEDGVARKNTEPEPAPAPEPEPAPAPAPAPAPETETEEAKPIEEPVILSRAEPIEEPTPEPKEQTIAIPVSIEKPKGEKRVTLTINLNLNL